ncbi:MAG TPA: hypothetical protein VKQ72_15060, partial [Aggregatilineales bacterium]|nr:hypothetical protein [Aggregatilineales bacterium]
MESVQAHSGVSANVRDLARTRHRAKRREAILGLLFVAPATILTFIFGLFPVLSGFFISMQGGTVLPQGFVGLQNYFTALGSLAYLLALALAFAMLIGSYMAFRVPIAAMQRGKGNFYLYLIPGTLAALAIMILLALLFAGYSLELSIWPLAMLTLAVGGYLYVDSREHGGMNYTLNSCLMMLLIFSAVFLTLYTFSELDTILTPYLMALSQVVSYAKFVMPLNVQFIALLGAAAAGSAAFVAGHIRSQIDFDQKPRSALLFGLLRWLMLITAVLLIVFILGALNLLQGTLSAFA